MFRCVTLAAALAAFALPAAAQVQRPFPQDALRGVVVFAGDADVSLNGKRARLAPGARIRGQDNMLQTFGYWTGQKRLVHYTVDSSGLLMNVWVLTPAEEAKKPWPVTPIEARTWQFNADAQTWSRP